MTASLPDRSCAALIAAAPVLIVCVQTSCQMLRNARLRCHQGHGPVHRSQLFAVGCVNAQTCGGGWIIPAAAFSERSLCVVLQSRAGRFWIGLTD